MFVTVVRDANRLLAVVHYAECQVDISASQENVHSLLREVYSPIMSPMDFARANYQLNRLRPFGITWELMLSNEYKQSGN